ncbi:D site-binding protein isoform 3-T3 [Dama dama]
MASRDEECAPGIEPLPAALKECGGGEKGVLCAGSPEGKGAQGAPASGNSPRAGPGDGGPGGCFSWGGGGRWVPEGTPGGCARPGFVGAATVGADTAVRRRGVRGPGRLPAGARAPSQPAAPGRRVASALTGLTSRDTPSPVDPDTVEVLMTFEPDPADLALSSIPGHETFDPRRHRFSEEELKPQPIMKKARKIQVPEEQKDEKYWSRRYKNNEAAKRSRDARRLKENQISVRAAFLEKENALLRQEVVAVRQELSHYRAVLSRYQAQHGAL